MSLAASVALLAHVHAVPTGWSIAGRAPAESVQRVHLGLTQSAAGLQELERRLAKAADPTGGAYSQWLSQAEVVGLVGPGEAAFVAVESWAARCGGARPQRTGGDAVVLEASVRQLECLFGAPLHSVRAPSGRALVRALAPLELPPAVSELVELVTPLRDFRFAAARRGSGSAVPVEGAAEGDGHCGVVPQTLAGMYGGAMQSVRAGSTATQAVAELQHALGPEGFNAKNIDHFQEAMLLPASLQPAAVVGHNDGIDPTGECTLDTQYIYI